MPTPAAAPAAAVGPALPWLGVLLLAMLSVQAGSAWAKQIFGALGPTETAAWRLLLSALMLAALSRPWRWPVPPAARRGLLGLGLALVLMNAGFYQALARLPLGLAVALEFTGPLAVAAWTSRRPRELACAALAVAGVVGITPWHAAGAERLAVGCLWAVLAGVGWAAYILLGRSLGRLMPAQQALSWGMAVAAAIVVVATSLMAGAPWPACAWPPAKMWPALVGMAAISSTLPYSLEMRVLGRLDPYTFSVMLSLEPAAATVAGAVLLGERLALDQGLAIACIVVAALGSALRPTAPQPRPRPDR